MNKSDVCKIIFTEYGLIINIKDTETSYSVESDSQTIFDFDKDNALSSIELLLNKKLSEKIKKAVIWK